MDIKNKVNLGMVVVGVLVSIIIARSPTLFGNGWVTGIVYMMVLVLVAVIGVHIENHYARKK
jgi:hypothetical protein